MTPLWIAVFSWCAGTAICYLLGAALWWVSAVGVVPLLMGMYVGYKTGAALAEERCRNLLRNQSYR